MEKAMEIRRVPFLGEELVAVRDNQSGTVYAALTPILRGLGFDEKQVEYQRDKLLADKVIAKGTRKFSGTLLGAKTGRDTWGISLGKLPLAFAKIGVTPTMEREMPQLSATLEAYQDRCADVLAAAFLPEKFGGQATQGGKEALAEAKLNNSRARMAAEWRKIAGMVSIPEYKDICASHASAALAGREVLPLPETTECTYTAEEVGVMLGGLSGAKVGRIANQNGLKAPEYGLEVWDKSRYSSKQVPAWRYNDKAIERFREILGLTE